MNVCVLLLLLTLLCVIWDFITVTQHRVVVSDVGMKIFTNKCQTRERFNRVSLSSDLHAGTDDHQILPYRGKNRLLLFIQQDGPVRRGHYNFDQIAQIEAHTPR